MTGGAAARLALLNGGILQGVFGQPLLALLAALLRVFWLIAFLESYVEPRGGRVTASTG